MLDWVHNLEIGIQSQDSENAQLDCARVLCNLGNWLCNLRILRMRNAIPRLRKFSDCEEHTPILGVHAVPAANENNSERQLAEMTKAARVRQTVVV